MYNKLVTEVNDIDNKKLNLKELTTIEKLKKLRTKYQSMINLLLLLILVN